jgi:hypothetical protein
MNRDGRYLALMLLFTCLFIIGCQPIGNSKSPEVDIYTFPPKTDSPSPAMTPGQPQDLTQSSQTADKPRQDYVEHRIVVDEHNNAFPIGIPSITKEETEIIAEERIDFWFEYIPDDLELEVDGAVVQHSLHWEFKTRYTTGVTKFRYVITNSTSNFYSYNLHLIPAKAGDSVSVMVRQRWSGL